VYIYGSIPVSTIAFHIPVQQLEISAVRKQEVIMLGGTRLLFGT